MRRPLLAYAMLSPAIVAVIFLIAYPIWVAINVSTREGAR